MLTVLMKASVFICIIALGYLLKHKGYFQPSDFKLISKIVMGITLPCAIITNFSQIMVKKELLILVPLGILCNLVMIGLGYLSGRHKGKKEQVFNMINFSGYNIGCFTLPYVQNFLGPAGVVGTCLFDAGNSLLCTGGTYSIASLVADRGEKSTLSSFLTKIFSSVPLDTYLVMLLLGCLHISLPQGVLAFASAAGSANGFLAMLMIGIGFELKLEKDKLLHIGRVLFFRYGMAVMFAGLFYFALPVSAEMKKVMVLICFAPVSAVCTAFTERCGGDVELSSAVNSISIVLSIALMTSVLLWMQ